MSDQPGPQDRADRRAADRHDKGVDVFGELQRWFIRQSAKNMRREIGGQVRRTFGGGREHTDVWDTATNEIPPEVGESPECQWCPICRAARRMRDAGPGIGGQLSGASDVVASAVQDAISALDSLLNKAGGGPGREGPATDTGSGQSAPPGSAGSATSAARAPASGGERPGLVGLPNGRDSARAQSQGDSPGRADGSSPASGLDGRPATEQGSEPDPWGAATDPTDAGQNSDSDAQSDGPAHWA